MELKLSCYFLSNSWSISLNRTFYGIETHYSVCHALKAGVLIVPFMELKLPLQYHFGGRQRVLIVPFMELKLLNRTFYGIETLSSWKTLHGVRVLIVPFMELKRS